MYGGGPGSYVERATFNDHVPNQDEGGWAARGAGTATSARKVAARIPTQGCRAGVPPASGSGPDGKAWG